MEQFRTDNKYINQQFLWRNEELCMVLDKVTGKPERFANNDAIGSFALAKEYVSHRHGLEDRLVIVKMNCIAARKL